MQQIYRRTPVPKCDFNKVAAQSNFFPRKQPFRRNTSGWLLLFKGFSIQVLQNRNIYELCLLSPGLTNIRLNNFRKTEISSSWIRTRTFCTGTYNYLRKSCAAKGRRSQENLCLKKDCKIITEYLFYSVFACLLYIKDFYVFYLKKFESSCSLNSQISSLSQ